MRENLVNPDQHNIIDNFMSDFRRTPLHLPQSPESSCVMEVSDREFILLSMLWGSWNLEWIHTLKRPTFTPVLTIITAVLVFS